MISAGDDGDGAVGTRGVLHQTPVGLIGAIGGVPSATGEYEIAIGAVIGQAHSARDRLVAE